MSNVYLIVGQRTERTSDPATYRLDGHHIAGVYHGLSLALEHAESLRRESASAGDFGPRWRNVIVLECKAVG